MKRPCIAHLVARTWHCIRFCTRASQPRYRSCIAMCNRTSACGYCWPRLWDGNATADRAPRAHIPTALFSHGRSPYVHARRSAMKHAKHAKLVIHSCEAGPAQLASCGCATVLIVIVSPTRCMQIQAAPGSASTTMCWRGLES